MSKDKSDNIYYSAFINADSNSQASMRDKRAYPLLYKPSDYKMTVTEFAVDTGSIPLKVVQTVQDLGDITNVNRTDYVVAILDKNVTTRNSIVNTVWITEDSNAPVPLTYSSTNNIAFHQYYSLYSYHHFVRQVNVALLAAYTASGVVANVGITAAPYIIINSDGSLSLIVQQTYQAGGNNVHIYFNEKLYDDLTFESTYGFQQIGATLFEGQDLYVGNNYNNYLTIPTGSPGAGTLAWVMTQTIPSVGNINDIGRVLLLSSNLPTKNQYFNSLGTSVSNGDVFKQIVAELAFNNNISSGLRSNLLYSQDSEMKWIDLASDDALFDLNLNFVWVDQDQNIFPIVIGVHQSCYAKILFKRKNVIDDSIRFMIK